MDDEAKHASLGCYRATFTPLYRLFCHTKEPLFHTNSGSVGVEKRRFLYIMGATTLQNTIKTASEISKSDFYFVTDYYRPCDICMGHEEMRVCILCFYAHPHKSPALLNLHLICADTVGCYHLYYVYAWGESADGFGWGGFCLVIHYMTGDVADYDAGGG